MVLKVWGEGWGWCRLKNFRMAEKAVTLDIGIEQFNSFESLSRSNASHQVFAQSDLWFGRRYHLKNFKTAAMAAFLISKWNDHSNSESL